MSEVIKFKLKPDMYPHSFLFWFGEWNEDIVRKWCKQLSVIQRDDWAPWENPTDRGYGVHFPLEYGSLIWMPKKPERAYDYSTLIHEIQHATMHCGTRCGFKVSRDSEEFYCFMIGWLSHQLFKKLW